MKILFSYLALLNILDGAATYMGLYYSMIEESNPLMGHLYEINPLLFLGVKLFLSGVLYGFTLTKWLPTSRLLKGLSIAASIIYTIVIGLHGVWVLPMIVYQL